MIPFWRRSSFRTICPALVAGMMAGCNLQPAFQTPVGPTPTLSQLAGSWGGRFDAGRAVDHCWGLEWTAAQDGTNATGRLRIGGVGTGVTFNPVMGTMTATPSGSGFTLALTVPPGATSNPACSMTGTGTVSAGRSPESPETIMVGKVTLEWTAACSGFLYRTSINTHSGDFLLVKDDRVHPGC